MENIQAFFTKHRAIIAFLVGIAFFAVLFAFHYTEEVKDSKDELFSYAVNETENRTVLPKMLLPGNVVVQRFTPAAGEYKGVTIDVATFKRTNTGSIEVSLSGNGVEKTWNFDCAQLEDNSSVPLYFDEGMSIPDNTEFTLTIVSNTQSAALCPTIYACEKNEDTVSKNVLTINGVEENSTLRIGMIVSQKTFVQTDYLILGAMFAFVLVLVFALMLRCKKLKTENIVMMLVLLIGTGYTFIFTPMSVPDEYTHYASAYSYSNKMMFDFSDDEDGTNMRNEDYMLQDTVKNYVTAEEYYRIHHDFSIKSTDSQIVRCERTPMENRGLAYAFQAIGITIGRVLHLGAYPTYYLGRLFNLLLFALCVFFSIKIIPIGKIALAVIALLPMTMHLAGSYSYDVYTIGMCMLLFAQLMKLLYSDETITFKSFLLTAIIAFLAIPYKVAYAGLGCLALLIPKEKFKNKKQHAIFKTILIFAGVIGIIVIQHSMFSRVTGEPQTLTYDDTKTKFSLDYILSYPQNVVSLLARTLLANGTWYFQSMIGSSLGWFQIPVNGLIVLAFVGLLLASFIKKAGEPKALRPLEKWYSFAIIGGTVILVMLLLMLDWTPIDSPIIEGVQGRYLIPVLPVLILLFRNDSIVNSFKTDKPILYSAFYLNIIVLLETFSFAIAQ